MAIQLRTQTWPPVLRQGATETFLDKPLAGTVDGGETHAQQVSDFFISGSFSGVE
jgi:hypothetical protein